MHVLFFHQKHLDVEYGDNARLRGALYEAFARQIDRHLGRQVHQIHGVDLEPVRVTNRAEGEDALARYLGKIQLEMTRQDLKVGRSMASRSPWQIGVDAAETGDAQDAARWVEYLRATKGRNVVTQGGNLADHYGQPTDEQLDQLLCDHEQPDDQADDGDDGDEGQDVASMDADIWTDLINHRTDLTTSAAADAITRLEQAGPRAMAELISAQLAKAVHIISHHESGLPHLRYLDPAHRRRQVGDRNRRRAEPDIDLNNLGPIARAWYGATNHQTKEKQ